MDREEVTDKPEIGSRPYVRFAMDARGTPRLYEKSPLASIDYY